MGLGFRVFGKNVESDLTWQLRLGSDFWVKGLGKHVTKNPETLNLNPRPSSRK